MHVHTYIHMYDHSVHIYLFLVPLWLELRIWKPRICFPFFFPHGHAPPPPLLPRCIWWGKKSKPYAINLPHHKPFFLGRGGRPWMTRASNPRSANVRMSRERESILHSPILVVKGGVFFSWTSTNPPPCRPHRKFFGDPVRVLAWKRVPKRGCVRVYHQMRTPHTPPFSKIPNQSFFIFSCCTNYLYAKIRTKWSQKRVLHTRQLTESPFIWVNHSSRLNARAPPPPQPQVVSCVFFFPPAYPCFACLALPTYIRFRKMCRGGGGAICGLDDFGEFENGERCGQRLVTGSTFWGSRIFFSSFFFALVYVCKVAYIEHLLQIFKKYVHMYPLAS